MAEAVRLVIWDLDETFWSGALTEGGIRYQRGTHDIVIELARRGIMNSICSKNDFAAVREILITKGIWDYFIFPSINWEPKGPRILRIIENTQLRAQTVLLIDDNVLNRNEALHFSPGLQIADETILATLLDDLRFRGQIDSERKRLMQYKMLERRREDQDLHGDNLDFLRSSGINVSIENDIDAHIDRAIELINRTNQLNFTKRRLPEKIVEARSELRQELRERNTQAGLVRVKDNYGDHGFSGIYVLKVHSWHLVHFCFSCRTVGLGIERWLYNRLRRPAIAIVGAVIVNLFDSEPLIDWINAGAEISDKEAPKKIGRVFVCGGCETQAVAHYMALDAEQLETAFAFDRAGSPVPIHHTVILRAAIDGISKAELAAALTLGYEESDFESSAVNSTAPFDVYFYSFWADSHYAVYRDRETSLCLPFGIHGLNSGTDLRQAAAEELRAKLITPEMRARFESLRQRFDYLSWSPGIYVTPSETLMESNLRLLFNACPSTAEIFVLLACERVFDIHGQPQPVAHLTELNRVTRRAAAGIPRIHLLTLEDFIVTPEDLIDATHFDRRVYYRVYQRIRELRRSQHSAL